MATTSEYGIGGRHLSRAAVAGILTAVCLTTFVLLVAMVFLLFRAINNHKHLIADLEARGVAVRPPFVGEVRDEHSPTRPVRAVLRKNYIFPYFSGRDHHTNSTLYDHDKSTLSFQQSKHSAYLTESNIKLSPTYSQSRQTRRILERLYECPHIASAQDLPLYDRTTTGTHNVGNRSRHIVDCQVSPRAQSHQTRFSVKAGAVLGPPIPLRSSSRPQTQTIPTANLGSRLSTQRSLLSKHDSAMSGGLAVRSKGMSPLKSVQHAQSKSGMNQEPDAEYHLSRTRTHHRSDCPNGAGSPTVFRALSPSQPLSISEVLDPTSLTNTTGTRMDARRSGDDVVPRNRNCSPVREVPGHKLDDHRTSANSYHSSTARIERAGTPMAFYESPCTIKENVRSSPEQATTKRSKIILKSRHQSTPTSSPSKTNKSCSRVVLGELSSNGTVAGQTSQRSSDSPSTRSSNENPFRWELSPVPSENARPRDPKTSPKKSTLSTKPRRSIILYTKKPRKPGRKTSSPMQREPPSNTSGNSAIHNTGSPIRRPKPSKFNLTLMPSPKSSPISPGPPQAPSTHSSYRVSSTSNTLPFRIPIYTSPSAGNSHLDLSPSPPSPRSPTLPRPTAPTQTPTRRTRSRTDFSSILSPSLFEPPPPLPSDPISHPAAADPSSLSSPTFLGLFSPFPSPSAPPSPTGFTTRPPSPTTPLRAPSLPSAFSHSSPDLTSRPAAPSIRPDSATLEPSAVLLRTPSLPDLPSGGSASACLARRGSRTRANTERSVRTGGRSEGSGSGSGSGGQGECIPELVRMPTRGGAGGGVREELARSPTSLYDEDGFLQL